ncbi:EAL domain-containing protein [Streptomyces sp. NPDC005931]|uniref:EAL domain-containing protein n=1 Tax=Streptomyces sp. NPDC005931 TaxID=3364737 RepID=UPI003680464D
MTAQLVTAGILTGTYLAVQELRGPLWALIALAGAAGIVTGTRLHRPAHRWPWWLLAAGLLVSGAGGTYDQVRETYAHAVPAFPSPADVSSLIVYALLIAGLSGLVRYRFMGRDRPGLLDALVITSGLVLPVWVHLVQPLARFGELTWQQSAIGIARPLGGVVVLALLVRLLAAGREGGGPLRAVQLLAVGTGAMLSCDIARGILRLNDAGEGGALLDLGWIVFATACGLAALHPSMTELTAPGSPSPSLFPPWHRLLLLTVATLVPPAVLVHEESVGNAHEATVLAVLSAVLFVLVILRLAVMVVAHRRAVAREQALRTAAASLMQAFWPEEIARACDTAVTALFGPNVRHATRVLSAQQAEDLYTRLSGDQPERGGRADCLARHRALVVPVAALGPDLSGQFADVPAVLLCPMVRPGRPAGTETSGVLLAGGPVRQLAEMRGSLEILASHAGLVTERIALRREITRKESEAYFRTLVHNASDVILIVDDDTTVRYASPSARAVFGSTEPVGTELRALVAPPDRHRVTRTLTALLREGRQEVHDHWWVERGSESLEVDVHCRDLRHDRTVGGLVVTLRDVTEQRRLEHELTQRAFHDSLTGLPNRTLLLERTERALLRGRRESSITCMLFIDLDDFKIVNDTLGHKAGDGLLCAVAERLSETLRRTDTAARLGGDEFAVLMEDAKQPLDSELLAAQVIQTLNRPFQLPEATVAVSASVGVATAQDTTDAHELLALADLALYAAKAAGKRQWRRFEPQQRVRMVERHDLKAQLDGAITREEFTLCYQPVVDIAAGDVVGFEALARWPHLPTGPVPPGRFIPLAEESGHISTLGAWVLHRATADIARLQRRVPLAAPPYLSVNVSARQWRDMTFLDEVCTALDNAGLAPGTLQLELTESVLMKRTDQIDAVIRELKDVGVRIAIDDFGTGYASLRYLRDFPIDVLKIDKTFIDGIPGDSQQVALVEAILRLADTLGLQVIAEGIEEQEQRELLAAIGCRFGQGYLFARPMTVEEGEAVLRRSARGDVRAPFPDSAAEEHGRPHR